MRATETKTLVEGNLNDNFSYYAIDITNISDDCFSVECYWAEGKTKTREFTCEHDAHTWAMEMAIKIS
tara:strand:- start:220 stop:423 length:204 start_codon:yes stop_codon:yes gene_type:complete